MEIQQDKILHFLVSLLLVTGLHIKLNLFNSILITILICLIKEIYDGYFGSGFSNGDLIADALGIIMGILLIVTIKGGISC